MTKARTRNGLIPQVRLAKQLIVDSFDDLFDYLSQFKKLVNASRAKKLEKSHDPLALVAHTGSSSRNTSSYYVTHPSSVVDYDDEYDSRSRRRVKGKNVEETRISPIPSPTRSPRNLYSRIFGYRETPGIDGYSSYTIIRFMSRTSSDQLADNLHDVMMETLPSLVKEKVTEQVKKEVPAQVRDQVPAQISSQIQNAIDNAIPSLVDASCKKAEDIGSMKHMYLESHRLDKLMYRNQILLLQIPTKQVTQDIMEEISLTIDEAKLKKMSDEMLRQRCTSGDEHQYHIDQMKNFLQSDIASRWVNKCIKKFNPYARYGVENWKNPHAKIFYIRRQKEPGRPKEEIYSNSKIVQVIKTYWELGHEHKFITEIGVRRANDCIVSITEPDYKNLNKNDIEDMYLLIVNNKVPDYANTGLLWSLSVFIRSLVIWERMHDFQLGIESYQQKINLTAPKITFP
ncbi:hypothetical protein Tco_0153214 [Tanacetum coccineum]